MEAELRDADRQKMMRNGEERGGRGGKEGESWQPRQPNTHPSGLLDQEQTFPEVPLKNLPAK